MGGVHTKLNKKDITNVLEKIGTPYVNGPAKNIAPDAVGIRCPYCPDDPSNHCGIFEGPANFSCWRCRESGPFIKLLRKLTGESEEYCKSLVGESDTNFQRDSENIVKDLLNDEKTETKKPKRQFDGLPSNTELIDESTNFPLLDSYLKKRGLIRKTIIDHCCGICRYGKHMNRLIIPVIYNCKVVSYQAADMTGWADLKYDTAPGGINQYLYNYDNIKQFGRIIIVEGVLDAWRAGDDAVATFGTHVTERQFHLILDKHPSELVFLWDQDAWLKTYPSGSIVGEFMPFIDTIKVVLLPENEDPDSFGLRFGQQAIFDLINATDYWS